jgi:hypothetical protein
MTLKRTLGLGFLLLAACTMAMMALPDLAHAQSAATSISTGLDAAAEGNFDSGISAPEFIGRAIQVLLSATGLIFLVITIYAGILYMTAAGEEKKVTDAKSMLKNALVGLIIIVAAYALTSYVIAALIEVSTT